MYDSRLYYKYLRNSVALYNRLYRNNEMSSCLDAESVNGRKNKVKIELFF